METSFRNLPKLYTVRFHKISRKLGEVMVFYIVHASVGFGSLIQRNIECFERQTILFFTLKTWDHCNIELFLLADI